jgi:membrane protease YdiL (CAAX protease family)
MDQNLPNNNQNQNTENKDDNGNSHSSIDLNHNLNPIISPISAAFIGLFGGFFLYQIVGGVLTLLVFGLEIDKAPVNGLRLMTMAGQILFILLPALLFSKWFYEDVTTVIRFKSSRWIEIGLFVVGLIILIPLLENFSVIQNYLIDKLAASSTTVNSVKNIFDSLNDRLEGTYSSLITAHSISEKLLVILVVAAVPAVCEEIMFRGFIQKSFELKLKPFWAILITSIFFGLYHFSPYGLLPLIILGLYFGFAAYKSESIFTSMSLHFLNNFSAIVVFFIAGNGQLLDSAPSDKAVDLKSAITIFVFLLLLFGGMLYVIVKFYQEKARNR